MSASLSILIWLLFKHIYKIKWLYLQSLKYKNSLKNKTNNLENVKIDKNVLVNELKDRLIKDIHEYRKLNPVLRTVNVFLDIDKKIASSSLMLPLTQTNSTRNSRFSIKFSPNIFFH